MRLAALPYAVGLIGNLHASTSYYYGSHQPVFTVAQGYFSAELKRPPVEVKAMGANAHAMLESVARVWTAFTDKVGGDV